MEFKVGGMTCVACSSSVERAMHNEFDKKSLVSASVVLLTHKLTVKFKAKVFNDKTVTPDMVVDEVEMIGFDCELLGINELRNDQNVNRIKVKKPG